MEVVYRDLVDGHGKRGKRSGSRFGGQWKLHWMDFSVRSSTEGSVGVGDILEEKIPAESGVRVVMVGGCSCSSKTPHRP